MSRKSKQKRRAEFCNYLKETWVENLVYISFTIGALCCYSLTMEIVSRSPVYKMFLHFNETLLLVAFCSLVVSLLCLVFRALKSLDEYEEETENTKRIIKSNKFILWILWLLWTGLGFALFKFPFFLTKVFSGLSITSLLDNETIFFISATTIFPGVLIAGLTEAIRWSELRSERKMGYPYGEEYERIWSGYIGLICIPVYFGLVIADYILNLFC